MKNAKKLVADVLREFDAAESDSTESIARNAIDICEFCRIHLVRLDRCITGIYRNDLSEFLKVAQVFRRLGHSLDTLNVSLQSAKTGVAAAIEVIDSQR